MKQIKFIIIPVAIYTVSLAFFSSASMEAAKNALSLCASSLLPALFPFFVCSSMLISLGAAHLLSKLFSPIMKPFFGLSGSCSLAMVMGYISGYPIGAKTAVDLYLNGNCSKSEAEKLLAFCNNSGPLFIIGAVGTGMIKDPSVGVAIYISHILSSLVVALLMRNVPIYPLSQKKLAGKKAYTGFGEIFTDAVSSSASLTLTVCGFVVMFAILISFIEQMGIINALASLGMNPGLCKAFIYGALECTGGCSAIIPAVKSPLFKYMLISSVIAWSGLSVHLQVLGIIKKAKLSPKLYFKGKALTAIISPVISMFLFGFVWGKLQFVPFMRIIVLFSTTVFAVSKTIFLLKRLYSKYSALPPR